MSFLDPTPITNTVILDYPLDKVKFAIHSLLSKYPRYFIAKKNGINDELHTYIFDRPKGIDTPTIRMTLLSLEGNKTSVEFYCTSNSMTVSPTDLQIAITEVQNILMSELKGEDNDNILKTIKENNSGNGLWGCLKTVGCLAFICIIILGLLGALLGN
ncbi:MAG: hypothetical protein IKH02_12685 [Prevotella sp.]|nr:hypothetical protein [Prevotella sp.]